MEEDIIRLVKKHPGETLVVKNGEVVQEDPIEAYNKAIEEGLVPEFYTLKEGEEPAKVLSQPLTKESVR